MVSATVQGKTERGTKIRVDVLKSVEVSAKNISSVLSDEDIVLALIKNSGGLKFLAETINPASQRSALYDAIVRYCTVAIEVTNRFEGCKLLASIKDPSSGRSALHVAVGFKPVVSIMMGSLDRIGLLQETKDSWGESAYTCASKTVAEGKLREDDGN